MASAATGVSWWGVGPDGAPGPLDAGADRDRALAAGLTRRADGQGLVDSQRALVVQLRRQGADAALTGGRRDRAGVDQRAAADGQPRRVEGAVDRGQVDGPGV